MPQRTPIEWCDYSSNPLKAMFGDKKGWHCVKISPGCKNCYAATINMRFGTLKEYIAANTKLHRIYLEQAELHHLLTFQPRGPYKNGRDRPIVFPFDMTDVFGEWVGDELIDKFMAVVMLRPDVDFMVLTKRAKRMHDYFREFEFDELVMRWGSAAGEFLDGAWIHGAGKKHRERIEKFISNCHGLEDDDNTQIETPLAFPPHLWLGVSAEDQQRFEDRVGWLAAIPAAVRFLSLEPLLGPIDLQFDRRVYQIQLAIVGGESGSGSRDCNLRDIDCIVKQCRAAAVDCYVKQVGSKPIERIEADLAKAMFPNGPPPGSHVAGNYVSLRTLSYKDSKGGDPLEWPRDIRVRQMPGRVDAYRGAFHGK